MITGTLSDHYKYMKNLGQVNFRFQLSGITLTFTNGANYGTINAGSGSFVTAGAVVGDRVYTNSSHAGNNGPFIIIAVAASVLNVIQQSGATPVFTNSGNPESSLTVGTSLLKCMLTRSGFSFNKATCGKLINFQNILAGGGNTVIISGTNTVGMAYGGFLAAGFVVGNAITFAGFTNGGNNATFKIATLSDTAMTVTHLDGSAPSLTNEGPSSPITFTTSDELANGNGYTTGGVLSGVPVLTEDDTNHWGQVVIPTLTWTASGGSIGPSASLIIIDLGTSDNTIVGNLDFSGDQTAVNGSTFVVAGGTIREV
jgi:hypothetical protein